MDKRFVMSFLAVLCIFSAGAVYAAPVIENPSFETGNYSGWEVVNSSNYIGTHSDGYQWWEPYAVSDISPDGAATDGDWYVLWNDNGLYQVTSGTIGQDEVYVVSVDACSAWNAVAVKVDLGYEDGGEYVVEATESFVPTRRLEQMPDGRWLYVGLWERFTLEYIPSADAVGKPLYIKVGNDDVGEWLAIDNIVLLTSTSTGNPVISVLPQTIDVSAYHLATNPADEIIGIRSAADPNYPDDIVLHWTLDYDCSWLSAEPVSGISTGEIDKVTLSFDTLGLDVGNYNCQLTVSDPQATNSPQIVDVNLTINPVIYVPGDFSTIQSAIDYASEGDIIVVADGTYTGAGNRDIDFAGKAVTLCSASGAESCIIDCEGDLSNPHRAFNFHSNEGSGSVVQGFTIRNGNQDYGGGIRCQNSNPTIKSCIITNNTAYFSGSGIYCDGGDAVIESCRLYGNSGSLRGGAIGIDSSSPVIVNCLITDNSSIEYGGAISCEGEYSGPAIVNCTICGNTTTSGGGINLINGTAQIVNAILWDNIPNQIAYGSTGTAIVTCCDVQGGWAGDGNIDLNPEFLAPGDYHLALGSPCVDAGISILPINLPETDIEGAPRFLDGNGDGWQAVDMGCYEVYFEPGTSILALSPTSFKFVCEVEDPYPEPQILSIWNVGDGILNWEVDNDCSWLTVSPDSGSCEDEVSYVTLTIDATGLAPDMYDCVVTVRDTSRPDSVKYVQVQLRVGTILHVPSQYATIQDAVDAAFDGDEIVVADGIYTGTGNNNIDFMGKEIIVRSLDGPENCIIDCQGADYGFNFHYSENEKSIVNRFTITNASVAGVSVINFGTSPVIRNCIIKNNSRGIFSNASPTIINCVISDNYSSDNGGGILCLESSNATISRCIIKNNSAANYGGGIYCYGTTTIKNCVVTGNIAETGSGGGVCCYLNGHYITNCTIADNSAAVNGGGINCYGYAEVTLLNSIVLDGMYQTEGTINASYCDIEGGWTGTGNIDLDPLFGDDYHLSANSPCIDRGKPDFWLEDVDIDGEPRVMGGRIDIGADEFFDDTFLLFNPSFELPGINKIIGWDMEDGAVFVLVGGGVIGPAEVPGWQSDGEVVDSGVSYVTDQIIYIEDGLWFGFLMGDDPTVWQLTSHTIMPGEVFTLQFDAYNYWDGPDVTANLYYYDDGARVVAASVTVTDLVNQSGEVVVGTLEFVANDVPEAIGKKIGVEFDNPRSDDEFQYGSWCAFDNVRLDVSAQNYIPNPSFEIDDDSDEVPDGWSMYSSGDSTLEFFTDPNFARTGSVSSHFRAGNDGYAVLVSDYIPIEPNLVYEVGMWARDLMPGGNPSVVEPLIRIDYFNDSGLIDSETVSVPVDPNGYYNLVYGQTMQVPPNVDSIRVCPSVINSTGAGEADYVFDDVYCFELAAVSVLAPNGDEILTAGHIYTITWEIIGAVEDVLIEYSADNGLTWNVVDTVSNTGSYDWIVPEENSDFCLVRVSDADDPRVSDMSDSVFTIETLIEASIEILSPNGGETLIVGSMCAITWEYEGTIASVQIEYSVDNGSAWSVIDTIINTVSYDWIVPEENSDLCLVRVSDADNPSINDTSDSVFTIESTSVQLLEDLIEDLMELDLEVGLENKLLSKLETALQKLTDSSANNDVLAVSSLQDFICIVGDQPGNVIFKEDAEALIAAAQQIIEMISGG